MDTVIVIIECGGDDKANGDVHHLEIVMFVYSKSRNASRHHGQRMQMTFHNNQTHTLSKKVPLLAAVHRANKLWQRLLE